MSKREDIKQRLQTGLVIGDGAMGTQIQQVAPKLLCPEELLFSQPEAVEQIHRNYVEAGAELITTNTFGGSGHKLKLAGMSEHSAVEVNRIAAQIARKAAGDDALVLGDIGPLGELLEPLGEITEADAFNFFKDQASGLVEGGADIIIIETCIDLNEMRVTAEAVKSVCDLTLIVSMTFDKVVDGYRNMMGNAPQQAAQLALDAGADIVGCNCGVDISGHTDIVKMLREVATDGPLMCQPNAGLPELIGGKMVYKQTPESMAKQATQLLDAGATIIGGCCGTTPEYIRLLCEALNASAK
jgi:5-methyltetrahydrofolate--homocysteine methyltransferase